MFRSLARWCHEHAWIVVGLWIAALAGAFVLTGTLGPKYDSSFSSPDSESTRGFAVLQEYFPGSGSQFSGQIVFTADDVNDPTVVDAMSKMFDEADQIDGISIVSPYTEFGADQISPDGTVAYAEVNVDPDVDQTRGTEIGAELRDDIPQVDGLRVEIGGALFAEFEPPETELIGLSFAIIVLILAFGSVLAMGLPIGVALAGVGVGNLGVVVLLTRALTIPDFAPLVGVMIGLGAGIDYALFIVTRYRESTRAGLPPEEAVETAMDTAGRAVLFAGTTVVVSLLGMLLIGLEFIAGMGIAAAATVFTTLVASLTLLPALLWLTHSRVEVTRWRGLIAAGFASVTLLGLGLGIAPIGLVGAAGAVIAIVAGFFVRQLRAQVRPRAHKPLRQTLAYRWSRLIQRRPWSWLLLGAALLAIMTIPVFSLHLGFSDEGNYPESTTTRQAYDLVAEGFGPGSNGPFVLAVTTDSPDDAAVVQTLAETVAAVPGVAEVSPPFPNNMQDPAASEAFVIQIIPTTAPQDAATQDTIVAIRDAVAPVVEGTGVTADLTGAVPAAVDFSGYLSGRIFIFYGAVLGVSFLLLMMVFRSLLVPLKAVIMNVLSITAAYGVTVAIFQWGWFGNLFNIDGAPIEPFVPMMLFAIVFGLSMDYEVFLLSRIKEEYDRTGDPHGSVADGLAATARVITAAAAIMVVVFGSFLLEDQRIIKLFGTGLAVAVLLDATLVRMLLVPATMELLGSRNWWLPRWLDRILPTLNVEGAHPGDAHVADDDADTADDDSMSSDDERAPAPTG